MSPRRAALVLLGLALVGGLAWRLVPAGARNPFHYPFASAPEPDLDRSIEFHAQRVRQNPQGFLDRSTLAGLYLQKARSGDPAWFLLAEKEAAASLADMPTRNEGAKLVLAGVAEARHDFPRALGLVDEVLAENPGDADAMAQKSTILLARGDLRGAAALADALVAAAPGGPARNLRAQVRLAQGSLAEAEADLRAALREEQAGQRRSSARTRALLGRVLSLQGRPAAEAFEAALAVDPEEPIALSGLAALREQEEPAEAEALYRRLESRTDAAGIDLARVLARTGRSAEAEAQLRRTEASLRRTLESDPTGHRRDLARLLLERDQVPEALGLLEQDLQVRRDAGTLRMLAEARRRAGRPDDALKALHEALERGYRSPGLLLQAATLEEALGRTTAAAEHRREAGTAQPSPLDRAVGAEAEH